MMANNSKNNSDTSSIFSTTKSSSYKSVLLAKIQERKEECMRREREIDSLSSSIDQQISKTFTEESFDDEDLMYDTTKKFIIDNNNNNIPTIFPPLNEESHGQGSQEQLLTIEKHHRRRPTSHFWMETMIRRDPETKGRYVMSLQTSYNGTFPIFIAEKQKNGSYFIYNIPITDEERKENGSKNAVLGSLQKRSRTKKINSHRPDSSLMTYEVIHHAAPTTLSSSTNTHTFIVIDRINSTKTDTITTTTTTVNSVDNVTATFDYEYVKKVKHLLDPRPRYAQIKMHGREYVETKEPNVESGSGGQRVLDFKGRGRIVSSKNIQVVNNNKKNAGTTHGSSGEVVLQMVKQDDNDFCLDFSPPFDAFHAFAFALAQFDF